MSRQTKGASQGSRDNGILDALKRFAPLKEIHELLPSRLIWMLSQRHADAVSVIDDFHHEGIWSAATQLPPNPQKWPKIDPSKPEWIQLQVIPRLLETYRKVARPPQYHRE